VSELEAELEREHRETEQRYVRNLNPLVEHEANTLHVARRKARKKRYGRCRELDRGTPRMRLHQKRDHAQVSHGRLAKIREQRLDAVRASQERGMLSPWTLLRGQVPVEAIGTLRTQKGVGAFTLESANVGGVPVPKTILQELVTYYSRSESQPKGIDIEAPFQLPAHILEIRTAQGQALVVQ